MTLDKFGRHIIKHPRVSVVNQEMFYHHILTFTSNSIFNSKYVITPYNTDYIFPLQYGIIDNILVNRNDVFININDNTISKEEAINYALKLNDNISFRLDNNVEQDVVSLKTVRFVDYKLPLTQNDTKQDVIQSKNVRPVDKELLFNASGTHETSTTDKTLFVEIILKCPIKFEDKQYS